jgi:hypothetical protein
MIYGRPGYFVRGRMIIRLTHSPPSARQQIVYLSKSSCMSPNDLTAGGDGTRGWVVEDPKHTTARKPGPLYINNMQYSWVSTLLERTQMYSGSKT